MPIPVEFVGDIADDGYGSIDIGESTLASSRSPYEAETTSSRLIVRDYGSVWVTVSGGPGNARDWVGVFRSGDFNFAFISWKYLNNTQVRPPIGLTGGTVDLVVPSVPGNYEFRFMTASGVNDYAQLVASGTIVVG